MNLENDDLSIFLDLWNQQENSTSWYAQTIHTIAFSRMHDIWNIFIEGVTSLLVFTVCLNKPIFNQGKLQKLSQIAQTKINHAQQTIDEAENYVKDEIYRLVMQRQEKEEYIEELKMKIQSLIDITQEREQHEREAIDQVNIAEMEVGIHSNHVKETKESATFSTAGTAVVGVSASIFGGPISWAASLWLAASTIILYKSLNDANKNLEISQNKLEIRKTELIETQNRLFKIRREFDEKRFELDNLDVHHENMLNELRQLTQLKTSTTKFNDYIIETLGKVEFLNESQKIEKARADLNEIIEELVKHLSRFQSFENNTHIIQKLESLILQISNAECKGRDSFKTCYDNSCSVFCCCFGIICYAMRRLICCLDGFRL